MSKLQEQVLNDLAKDMEQSIDFEIQCGMMSQLGWTVLRVDYDPNSEQAWNTVRNWADDNLAGQHQEHRGTWLIELAQDATSFALKWKVRQ